jgi:Flp pilus assembly protein TadG
MRGLRRDGTGEDGAVAVIVAILMVALLMVGAVVVDLGAMYAKRRMLQNGADAAARAVAADCAKSQCGNYNSTGATYTVANEAAVTSADAGAPDTLVECGASLASLAANSCSAASSFVRVTANKTMTNKLARVVGIETSDVGARATVQWGAAAGLQSELPLTISMCEWKTATSNGTSFNAPPFPPYPSVKTLYFHDTTQAAGNSCPAGPSGGDNPIKGGFGWLKVNEDCVATTEAGSVWYDDKTGRPAPSSCEAADFQAMLGKIIHLPIYDGTNGLTGSNGKYHIAGYAAFYMTGFSINGQYKAKSLVTNQFPCNGPTSCIEGFFTKDFSPSPGTIGTGPNMGVTVTKMVD